MTRQDLIALYADWRNNFLTVEKFAAHYGIHEEHACRLIDVLRDIATTPHPEA